MMKFLNLRCLLLSGGTVAVTIGIMVFLELQTAPRTDRDWRTIFDQLEGDRENVAGYCMGGENRCAGSYAMTRSGLVYRIVENGNGDPSTRTVDQVWFATLMNGDYELQSAFNSQWAAIADPGDSDHELFQEAWCFQVGEDC